MAGIGGCERSIPYLACSTQLPVKLPVKSKEGTTMGAGAGGRGRTENQQGQPLARRLDWTRRREPVERLGAPSGAEGGQRQGP